MQPIYVIYSGKDVFICLPTGLGKSISFQKLPFLFAYKRGLVGVKKRNCAIIVSLLIALMVHQVRNLRKSGVQAVIISCGSRESSFVSKEFLVTTSSVTSATLTFSSPEALAHTKEFWKIPLCSAECVQLSLIKLTVCQSGKFSL